MSRSAQNLIDEIMPDALANPLPGDYWTEHLCPVMVVIRSFYPTGVLVCKTIKREGDDRMFDYTKLDFLTKADFIHLAKQGEIFHRQRHLDDVEKYFPSSNDKSTPTESEIHASQTHPDYEYKEVGFRISEVSSRHHSLSRIHELGDVELVFTPRDGWEINPYKTDRENLGNDHLDRQRKFYLYRRKKS